MMDIYALNSDRLTNAAGAVMGNRQIGRTVWWASLSSEPEVRS